MCRVSGLIKPDDSVVPVVLMNAQSEDSIELLINGNATWKADVKKLDFSGRKTEHLWVVLLFLMELLLKESIC